ncbi:hypothetical protein CTI12_AA328720 [Artemisia annua]|uniref:C2H2-type domain-containing protein n=1 Tax=Artemisia annua TaxID=35608 RepID=A0A2U1MY21_ARTAN|nr:hypothetical protein CTI12_AA328720 [Artemisia annua]
MKVRLTFVQAQPVEVNVVSHPIQRYVVWFGGSVLSSTKLIVIAVGIPGMTEALFLTRQTTVAKEKNKLNAPSKLYTCALCGNGCRSSKAHAQHHNSRSHTTRLSQNDDEFYDVSDGSDELRRLTGSGEWEETDVSNVWEEDMFIKLPPSKKSKKPAELTRATRVGLRRSHKA